MQKLVTIKKLSLQHIKWIRKNQTLGMSHMKGRNLFLYRAVITDGQIEPAVHRENCRS